MQSFRTQLHAHVVIEIFHTRLWVESTSTGAATALRACENEDRHPADKMPTVSGSSRHHNTIFIRSVTIRSALTLGDFRAVRVLLSTAADRSCDGSADRLLGTEAATCEPS